MLASAGSLSSPDRNPADIAPILEAVNTAILKARDASASEEAAALSALSAAQSAGAILGLSIQTHDLPSTSAASVDYDAVSGVLSIGIPQGIQGIQGESGTKQWYVAGQNLSGHCAVSIGVDSEMYVAGCDTYQAIAGITTMAAVMGDSVEVQSGGVISMIGWNFALNAPVFVLANGQVSTTPDPAALYSTVVGVSNSSNSFIVGIQPQIKLN